MTGVKVVGTAGAEPGRLAAALTRHGVETVDAGHDVLVVVLDLSCDVGSEEAAMLAGETAPTALVAHGVERHPDWPAATARARAALDPDCRLALFAVSAAAGDGVDQLAAWCRAPDSEPPEPLAPSEAPTPVVRLPTPAPRAAGPGRAERLAGFRAGVAAARTETVTAVRESVQALGVTADRACADVRRGDDRGYADWLVESIGAIERAAEAELDSRLQQVRRVAVIGLPGVDSESPTPEPALRPPSPPPHRTGGGEDAVVLILGATAGLGAGRMLVAPMVEGWFLGGVVTAAVGLAVAAWIVGVRRAAASRAALRRWTADAVALSRTALEHRLLARVAAVEGHGSREIWNRTAARRV